MISLRNIISTHSGMRFMVDSLGLCSPAGRRMLLSQQMYTDVAQIEKSIHELATVVDVVKHDENAKTVEALRHALSQLHDIHHTLTTLANAVVLDDIGLFEIKHFCLLSETVREYLEQCNCHILQLPDLQEVIGILDPENQRLPQFYIYPAYSSELALLRNRQQSLQPENTEQAEILRQQCIAIEDKIRQQLSVQLFDYAVILQQAHENLARLDILFAKALQAVKNNLNRPQIGRETTRYTQLFNPWVQNILAQQHKTFQPVDITFDTLPCLVTGANMGGKTVLLNTVALAQYLFQFGFYVPATEASIVPVEAVMCSMSDEQSELSGLSSFAAEMLNINEILLSARLGNKILALLDEPARTTNPAEGRAIVNAIVSLLATSGARSLVTTHYGNISAPCRKLRVKGLLTGKLNKEITVSNIRDYMDYSLLEHHADDVPLEALRIATMLGVDYELIEKAALFLKQNP